MTQTVLRRIMLFWCFFIGIGAFAGALLMMTDPGGDLMGMAAMLPDFQKLPFAAVFFQDFLVPGNALLICNGVTQLVAAGLLWRRSSYGSLAGMGCGVILMLWICVQFYIFPLNFLSTIYFVFGFLEFITAVLLRYLEVKKQKEGLPC